VGQKWTLNNAKLAQIRIHADSVVSRSGWLRNTSARPPNRFNPHSINELLPAA
jgi:hypothetical protein